MQALNFEGVRDSLKQWIDQLPLANPLKTSELIYSYLAQLPISQLNAHECFQLLEMLKPNIRLLEEVLQKHFYEKESLSVIEYSRQTALAISLLTRYASGYAVLLNSTNPEDTFKDGTPLAAVCIHRAIYNLSQVLIISYQLYMSPPTQIWLRLHKLYLQAEKNGYLTLKIPHQANEAPTIDDAYKVCILLASANPNQLRAADVIKLYSALLNWSRYTDIVSQNLPETNITFQLDEDAPPSYQAVNQRPTKSPFVRGLETARLIEHITTSIKQHSNSVMDQKAALPQNVLQNIAKAWNNYSHRIMQRSTRSGAIQVTIGMTSTHVHICGDKQFPQFGLNSQFIPPIDINPDEDSTLASPQMTANQHTTNIQSKYPLFNWQIINVSPQGYCLQTDIQHLAKFETGELVGLYQTVPQQVGHWRIGAIRWVKKVENQQFQVGVMILGPRVIPVAVQIARNTPKQYYRALILPELYSAEKANTIIIPALDLSETDNLIVLYPDHQVHIKLTEPIYLNDKFYQFKYEVLQEFSAKKTENEKKDDLDGIWDYLK